MTRETRPNDLQADLLIDLNTETSRPAPLPSAPALPPLPVIPTAAGTPAVTLRLTPLRWSRPRLDSAELGAGLAVRIGPLRVEFAV